MSVLSQYLTPKAREEGAPETSDIKTANDEALAAANDSDARRAARERKQKVVFDDPDKERKRLERKAQRKAERRAILELGSEEAFLATLTPEQVRERAVNIARREARVVEREAQRIRAEEEAAAREKALRAGIALSYLKDGEHALSTANYDTASASVRTALEHGLEKPADRIRAYRTLTTSMLMLNEQKALLPVLETALADDRDVRYKYWAEMAELFTAAGYPFVAIPFLKSLLPNGSDGENAAAPGEKIPAIEPIKVAIHLLPLVREFEGGMAMLSLLQEELADLLGHDNLRQVAVENAAKLKDVEFFKRVQQIAPVALTPQAAYVFAAHAAQRGEFADSFKVLATIPKVFPKAVAPSAPVLKPGVKLSPADKKKHDTLVAAHNIKKLEAAAKNKASTALRKKVDILTLEMQMATGAYEAAKRNLAALDAKLSLGKIGEFVKAFLAFIDGDVETAAAEMTQGFNVHYTTLVLHVPLYKLPEEFHVWFDKAAARGKHLMFWRMAMAEATRSEDAYVEMLLRFACIFITLRRPNVAYNILQSVIQWNGPGKVLAIRLQRRLSITHSFAELREYQPSEELNVNEESDGDLTVEFVLAGGSGDESIMLDRLSRLRRAYENGREIQDDEWATILGTARAIIAIQAGDMTKAQDIIAETGAFKRMAKLDAKPELTKIFAGGYGWSGSSAVYDALKVMPNICELPGPGDVEHLNFGADSEPMIFEGPWAMHVVWDAMLLNDKPAAEVLWNFFRIHVLATLEQNYLEHKATATVRNTHGQIGAAYADMSAIFISDLAAALSKPARRRYDADTLRPFQNLIGRLCKAIAANNNAKFILCNNGVRADEVESCAMSHKAVFISVVRDIRDQFTDQRMSNKYFEDTAKIFVGKQRTRRLAFLRGKYLMLGNGLAVDLFDVKFEDWVLNDAERERIIRHIIGFYDRDIEAQHFSPEESEKNIGVHVGFLTAEEENEFNGAIERSRKSLKYIEGDPFAGRAFQKTARARRANKE